MGEPARSLTVGPQPGPQAKLLSCPANEILYGGARGGGKSYGLLLDWMAHEARYGKDARGILFRRTMPELEDMLEKARELLPGFGWLYQEQKKTWVSSTGATLKMRYLERDNHADRYQGHQYTWCGLDEAGSWANPAPIDKLRATLRSPVVGKRVRMVLSANPGGAGHNWLKRRFIDPVQPYRLQHEINGQSTWTVCYIPARFADNRILQRADPGYLDRATAKLPEWLAKAWRDGDWNIVAGGMFDDVWQEDLHVIEPFEIPRTWRLDRAFDWGSSRPFAVGWFAESDGSDIVLADGTEMSFPRGSVFQVAEWYGWNGRPNEGLRMTATDIARGVVQQDASLGRVRPGPADTAIWTTQNGNCIADDMARAGCRWEKADKSPGSRVVGWDKVREMLGNVASQEDPAFHVFATCRNTIRTLPTLPRDAKNPDDVDSDSEDHIADMIRYRLAMPKRIASTIPLKGTY